MNTPVFICAPARLDGLNSGDFSTFASNLIDAGARRVVLDFTGLEYMASAGVRALLLLHRQLQANTGRLVLLGCRPQIRHVLHLSGLETLAPFAESFEAARLYAQAER